MKILPYVLVFTAGFGLATVFGMPYHVAAKSSAPVANDAAIRAAYAFAATPCDPMPVISPAKPSFKTVCPCGRLSECSCTEGECDCQACKLPPAGGKNICKCADAAHCQCGCNNGKECQCKPPQAATTQAAPFQTIFASNGSRGVVRRGGRCGPGG